MMIDFVFLILVGIGCGGLITPRLENSRVRLGYRRIAAFEARYAAGQPSFRDNALRLNIGSPEVRIFRLYHDGGLATPPGLCGAIGTLYPRGYWKQRPPQLDLRSLIDCDNLQATICPNIELFKRTGQRFPLPLATVPVPSQPRTSMETLLLCRFWPTSPTPPGLVGLFCIGSPWRCRMSGSAGCERIQQVADTAH